MNYLNTLPFMHGLEQHEVRDQIILIKDYPSRIAEMLLREELDLGLVPVGILPKMQSYVLVGDYGIASDGPVASVCLFSEVPIEEVEEVLLDYQSRTSLLLVKLLFRDVWKKQVLFLDTRTDFSHAIKGRRAGLMIGDRCLAFRSSALYMYDLGAVWKSHTGLPFVFAAWVARAALPSGFLASFQAALASGLSAIDTVIAQHPYPHFDLSIYLKHHIHYILNQRVKAGMQRFLHDLSTLSDQSR